MFAWYSPGPTFVVLYGTSSIITVTFPFTSSGTVIVILVGSPGTPGSTSTSIG